MARGCLFVNKTAINLLTGAEALHTTPVRSLLADHCRGVNIHDWRKQANTPEGTLMAHSWTPLTFLQDLNSTRWR
jgi:hypothetical protein